MSEQFNSAEDTLKHIRRVSELLTGTAAVELINRGNRHDDSKLGEVEKPLFDKYTPLLAKLKYGSPEYYESLNGLKPALDHHYANNSHHPEHYENGVDDYDLFDLIEMFFDWKAAGERTSAGNIFNSINHNKDRFNLSPQLVSILENTADRLGYERPVKEV